MFVAVKFPTKVPGRFGDQKCPNFAFEIVISGLQNKSTFMFFFLLLGNETVDSLETAFSTI